MTTPALRAAETRAGGGARATGAAPLSRDEIPAVSPTPGGTDAPLAGWAFMQPEPNLLGFAVVAGLVGLAVMLAVGGFLDGDPSAPSASTTPPAYQTAP